MDTGGAPSEIGTPTTLVWADELSEAAIIAGVHGGHTEVALRGPDDPLVELTTQGKTPLKVGDTATGNHVALTAHVVGGNGMTLSLVEDGKSPPASPSTKTTGPTTSTSRSAERRAAPRPAHRGRPIVVTSHLWLSEGSAGGCSVAPARAAAGAATSGGALAWLIFAALAAVSRARASRRR